MSKRLFILLQLGLKGKGRERHEVKICVYRIRFGSEWIFQHWFNLLVSFLKTHFYKEEFSVKEVGVTVQNLCCDVIPQHVPGQSGNGILWIAISQEVMAGSFWFLSCRCHQKIKIRKLGVMWWDDGACLDMSKLAQTIMFQNVDSFISNISRHVHGQSCTWLKW